MEILHVCTGKSILDWYDANPERFVIDPGPKPWWHNKRFSKTRTQGSFTVPDEGNMLNVTRYKVMKEQMIFLPKGSVVPSAEEVVDLILGPSENSCLLGEWTRTQTFFLLGRARFVVCVGKTRNGLVDIYDYYAERRASPRVGILPIIKNSNV